MNDPRTLLVRAVMFDWLGQLLILALVMLFPRLAGLPSDGMTLFSQTGWLLFMVLLYPALGWLFGSYTVLRWRRLTLPVLLQRLLLTAVATLMVVAIVRWLLNPGVELWLVHRRVQLLWMTGVSGWAFAVRLAMRRGLLLPESPRLFLLAEPDEIAQVMRAWKRVPERQRLWPTQPEVLLERMKRMDEPLLLAITPALRQHSELLPLLECSETSDPREIRMLSLLSLFQQQQERLPPAFIGQDGLAYDDLPWAATFSVQAQLKRMADLLVAAALLLITFPFVVISALLIWIEDQGPVFYTQQRSGWLGRPFWVIKLRTMSVQPSHEPPSWTKPGDRRITSVGGWLRRFRIDELPQLFNVLKGEMSLIGPRPERPEMEQELERQIPHYRKRHWMRPGLSGWAQVCAPYASSVEDSDLKLSYDLYYLLNFSTWLDLVILFRTIKTVLKAGGR
ncbi:undecaprenyl-phosphate glucose phosphotransferase [Synechococcus sp. BIOS-E4-1]|uniref:sugar transferase n=1 Tax=Synechococcus sp. BIOS-E4-1 TaxID=1400864 RepID=UPI001646AC6E|nr:sugar transferase [Synechococcus sp. BIOS-E4-1]QNI52673.1 undecaprenyl-phosphate glucose phosphotransferase [Synechococcus sp. BIOS-E4-1]